MDNFAQDLSFVELSRVFHLPISEAAEKLGVCPTILKKNCRKNGINRWPYRKIKSIDSLIESLQQVLDENGGKVPNINMGMEDLMNKRKYLMENPNVSYKSVVPKYCINSFRAQIEQAKSNIYSNKIETPIQKKTIVKKKFSGSTVRYEKFTTADAAELLSQWGKTRSYTPENNLLRCSSSLIQEMVPLRMSIS